MRIFLPCVLLIGIFLPTEVVQAQPPIQLEYFHDGVCAPFSQSSWSVLRAFRVKIIHSDNWGNSSLMYGGATNGWPTCQQGWWFSGGEVVEELPSGSRIVNLAPPHSGYITYDFGQLEPGYMSATFPAYAECATASGFEEVAVGIYSDGLSSGMVESMHRFPTDGTSWLTPVPQVPADIEYWGNKVLAARVPVIFQLDSLTGSFDSTWYVYPDTATLTNGKILVVDDTLYWATVRYGSTRVGAFDLVLGQPIWETTLPSTAMPRALKADPHDRVWTCSGNVLYWLDRNNGQFDSYTLGIEIGGLSMIGAEIFVAGTMDNETAFILKGFVTP